MSIEFDPLARDGYIMNWKVSWDAYFSTMEPSSEPVGDSDDGHNTVYSTFGEAKKNLHYFLKQQADAYRERAAEIWHMKE